MNVRFFLSSSLYYETVSRKQYHMLIRIASLTWTSFDVEIRNISVTIYTVTSLVSLAHSCIVRHWLLVTSLMPLGHATKQFLLHITVAGHCFPKPHAHATELQNACMEKDFLVFVRRRVVGWGTILQAGRSRFRFPMRSFEFQLT
jgi:hypothetical protein